MAVQVMRWGKRVTIDIWTGGIRSQLKYRAAKANKYIGKPVHRISVANVSICEKSAFL